MDTLFTKMCDALINGQDLVLCSIIASSGSTPRGSGAKMALFMDGSTMGTIGGGAVEYESIRLAKHAMSEKKAFTHGFELTHNQTADIGMICGGSVTVYFQFFAGGDRRAIDMFGAVAQLHRRRVNAWLVTKIAGSGVEDMGIYEEGAGLRFAKDIDEAAIRPLCQSRAVLRPGETTYYAEPIARAGHVYVFGGGHVSQELVPVISRAGFSAIVFEDRADFATRGLFPSADDIILGDFTKISEKIFIAPDDYIVIMTRGHQADFELLAQALRTEASYIGVIGSRHKIAATNKRLIEAGIPEAALSRIHTPIGLPIGAETPAEIAISIAAELISHRAALCGARA